MSDYEKTEEATTPPTTNSKDELNEKADPNITEHHATLVNDLTSVEGDLSALQAFRAYPKAALWSLYVSTAVIMVGYNSQIILSLFALPAFVDKYGTTNADGTKTLTASWQTALSMCYIGQVIGSLCVGFVSDRLGRKPTMIICNVLAIATNFIIFFAPNAGVLTAGEIIAGIPWGGFTQLAPLYAAEVSPIALRGILTAYVNMAWIIGQLVGQGVTAGCASRQDQWAYRIPFAMQWLWCLILAVGIPFMPESPWHLVRKGQKEKARSSLHRLGSKSTHANLDKILDVIDKTDMLERSLNGSVSWLDLFKGINRRRTEISVMVYNVQILAGISVSWYCNYFFTLAGLGTTQAFDLGVGNVAVGFLATSITFVALSYVGRRQVFLGGLTILTIIMFIIAILDTPSSYNTNRSFSWAQSILLVVWSFFYQLTIGPLGYVYLSEIPSTKLKSQSIALSSACFYTSLLVASVALPYMFNPDDGNMRGKVGFVFGGLSFLCLVWGYFRAPETKGLTFAAIDYLFEKKVSARHFKTYKIEDDEKAGLGKIKE